MDSAVYPPWWHEGTAKPGEVLTGRVRDQRDYVDSFRECPIYELELLEPTRLTVGETIDGDWTTETRQLDAGAVVTVRASCHILMAELAVREPVEDGERVKIGYFGKRDPAERTSPHLFKVKKLDRAGSVNHAKYARQLKEEQPSATDEPQRPEADVPPDTTGLASAGARSSDEEDIPFARPPVPELEFGPTRRRDLFTGDRVLG